MAKLYLEMEDRKDIILEHSLDGLGTDAVRGYLAHIYCGGGSCGMVFNGKEYTIAEGDCAIIRATGLISEVRPSEDFDVSAIYADPAFIDKATPRSNYGIRGSLYLFQDPVMHLTAQERIDCERDFAAMERRLNETGHNFYEEVIQAVMQVIILDFFNFHSRIYGELEIPTQAAGVMGRFIAMLERGDYRKNREVSHYASELCVAPKYLSEISKSISGFPANWWINRFTILDISRKLRDRSLDFTAIADEFGFSSPAYFSRYVQRYLGESPSDYRG